MQQTKHEKSDLGATDLSEMIKMAKAQQEEKSKQAAEKRKLESPKSKTVAVKNREGSMEHGSYAVGEDGIGGIIIDHELELEKMRENDKTGKKLMSLLDSNSLVIDVGSYTPDYGEDAPEGYDPGVQYIKDNPYDKKSQDMIKLKEEFAKYEIGLPGHGLVPKGSDEAKKVAAALEKLRTGEVVLPTPEEYEAQKKAAMERKARKQAQAQAEQQTVPTEQSNNESIPAIEEPTMGIMPENAVMKKGVEDLLNEINGIKTEEQEELIPMNKIDLSELEESPAEETVVEPPHHVLGQPLIPNKPPEPQPIDLVGLEEGLAEDAKAATPKPVEKKPEVKPEDIVTINVAEGEAETLMQNLPIETYNKVVSSKVVKVNEIELKDVPVKTTRLTDIAKYRMLSQRRPNTNTAEVTERVLINSGFIVTLKAATSLEMATIFSSPTSNDVDWEKEYIFCYEHTVGTSLGNLSYNEFVSRVAPTDIETILFGIYEISETDERKVSINCGQNDGGCGRTYEVTVPINTLPNLDALTPESRERINQIIAAKNSPEETRRIVKNSPPSIAKYVQCGDRILTVRTTTGNMMIERVERIDDIAETYNNAIIPLLTLYVESITISFKEREDAEPQDYLIDTLDILCEELSKLTDEEIEMIKEIILNDLVEYPTITYSIKGPCVCPHCGNVKDSIPSPISDLVFQKVRSVLA